ncbi:hypothetical protein [Nocardia gamkensis]|uniref:hypothetical protein n=1 Tax=Nocardia gamkensis TaxID=352869 RepID=UPI0037C58AE5
MVSLRPEREVSLSVEQFKAVRQLTLQIANGREDLERDDRTKAEPDPRQDMDAVACGRSYIANPSGPRWEAGYEFAAKIEAQL